MDKTFNISVKNKQAKNLSKIPYVCGNKDYRVAFDFDDDWNQYPIKTARFVTADGTPYEETVIDNQCKFPQIMDTFRADVGVYAGDLVTTTPAVVECLRSIRSGTGATPEVPEPDRYDQMMEAINADALRAEEAANEAEEKLENMQERYYTPNVDEDGNLTWEPNADDMPDLPPVNIKGPEGSQEIFVVRRLGSNGVDKTYAEIEAAIEQNLVVLLVVHGETYNYIRTTSAGMEFCRYYNSQNTTYLGIWESRAVLAKDGVLTFKTFTPAQTPNPRKLKFTGAVSAEYDGSSEVTVEIPEGGGGSGAGGAATPVDPTLTVAGAAADAEVTGKKFSKLTEEMAKKLGFDPTKQGLPIWYMWGDTTGEDKDNEVTLTYQFGEHSGTLKRKWQGSGSVGLGKELGAILGDENKGKFNYTIKLDQAIVAKEKWGAQKKYCLKAYVADFSHLRDRLSSVIWGQMSESRASRTVRLYKSPNWGTTDGFPVLLIVNGEYYGLFSMNVPKDGWMLNMPTEGATREAIVCAEVDASFKSTVVIGSGKTFKIEYVTDENDSDWVAESLNQIRAAIVNSDWKAFEAHVDIDSAIDYMLEVSRSTGGDAMTRNYCMFTEDGVKWSIFPYDKDTWYGINWGGDGHVADDYIPTLKSFMDASALMAMILSRVPERVTKRYWELHKKALSTSNIVETAMNIAAEIPKAVYDAEVARWPGIKATSTNNVFQMVDHIRARESIIDAEVERLDAPMLKPQATWFNAALAGIEMTALTEVNFDANYVATGSEDASWDCSAFANGSIMAYRTGTVVTVKPTAHKYVKLNIDSTEMFAGCKQLAKITGTEMFTADIKTTMQGACYNCNKLNTPIYIPHGVTNTIRMFGNTWVLRNTYDIPGTVFYMNGMFSGGGLFEAPEIPGSVLEMSEAFTGCPITRLPSAIPESVLAINYAFKMCYEASGLIEIRCKNITNYTEAFTLAARDTDGIVLVGPNTKLAEIAATNADGKVTVG